MFAEDRYVREIENLAQDRTSANQSLETWLYDDDIHILCLFVSYQISRSDDDNFSTALYDLLNLLFSFKYNFARAYLCPCITRVLCFRRTHTFTLDMYLKFLHLHISYLSFNKRVDRLQDQFPL